MNLLQDAFEQANGFSSLTVDELFFINGGCSDNAITSGNRPSIGGGSGSGGGGK
jgi:hypothetical protein